MTLSWEKQLNGAVPQDLKVQIDQFDGQMQLRKQGKISDKVFAETRLRRGAYGQRYDNGKRHDGIVSRDLIFENDGITKGPETHWDAPGMMRIKIPYGGVTAEQLEVMGQLADEYSDSILHVTTRQDIQLHFIHIEDTPDLMLRLAAVGITTQEACGNAVRNVTACPLSGVCRTQAFDVTPYADSLTQYFLGHDDAQDFGRKFKIAFSGCEAEACGLVKMHDLGLLAQVREIDGEKVRGFKLYVGGGLGTVPHQAKVLKDFVPITEILPFSQAVMRIFARLGEKQNRNRARLKFLIAKLGIEEFIRLVDEEYPTIPADERWTLIEKDAAAYEEHPLKAGYSLNGTTRPDGFGDWLLTNVYQQRQPNYSAVTIHLPLGDFTTDQAFMLADIAREFTGDSIRLTVEQNIVLRWVSNADLPALYQALVNAGLGAPGADTIEDITSCPGTDTCKLGIAASRGLTGELRTRLIEKRDELPQEIKDLKIKVSGCFNSCGQHHVADIGFFGNSRRKGSYRVPHFQVVLGGRWKDNAGAYGLGVGAVPSKQVPAVLDEITQRYVAEKTADEDFQAYIARLGKKEIRTLLRKYQDVPDIAEDATLYTDWGDPRPYTIGDIGIGECAGEVVSLFAIEIVKAEGEVFEAQEALDAGEFEEADERAFNAMLLAAKALVRTQFLDVGDNPDRIVSEFRTRLFDTQLFYDKYAKGKFGRYLFSRYETPPTTVTADSAHQLVEEALLFIEACHAADAKIAGMQPISNAASLFPSL